MNKAFWIRIVGLLWPISIALLIIYYVSTQYIFVFNRTPQWFSTVFWTGIVCLFITIVLEIVLKQDAGAPRHLTQQSANIIASFLKLFLAVALVLRYLDIKYGIIVLLISFLLLSAWNIAVMLYPNDKDEPKNKQDNLLDD